MMPPTGVARTKAESATAASVPSGVRARGARPSAYWGERDALEYLALSLAFDSNVDYSSLWCAAIFPGHSAMQRRSLALAPARNSSRCLRRHDIIGNAREFVYASPRATAAVARARAWTWQGGCE